MRDLGQGQVRNYFPAYRVFIYGFEVTPLVTSVRTSWPTGSPQQATIELLNPDNIFTLTYFDTLSIAAARGYKAQGAIELMKKLSAPVYENSMFDKSEIDLIEGEMGLFLSDWSGLMFQSPTPIPPVTAELAGIKNTIIPSKLSFSRFQSAPKGIDGSVLPAEIYFKYPFVCGKWVFHFTDPVRIAFRDPVDPAVWYWAHSGTVTDIAEKETEDKQSTLTITSEGVLKTLRNARIMQATFAFMLEKEPFQPLTEEQLSIQTAQGAYTNFLQNLTLFQIIELMIFGSTSIIDDFNTRASGASGMTYEEMLERYGGVLKKGRALNDRVTAEDAQWFTDQFRNLNIASIAKFKRWKKGQGTYVGILGGPLDPMDKSIGEAVDLNAWHYKIENQVKQVDLSNFMRGLPVHISTSDSSGRATEEVWEAARVEAAGTTESVESIITKIGTDPKNFPIEQRVLLLLPASLGSTLNRRVLDQEIISNASSNAEFYDRLSLLQQAIERIEFVIYDTPRGDIVIEMPLYDFEPYHFSKGKSGNSAVANPSGRNENYTYATLGMVDIQKAIDRGDYEVQALAESRNIDRQYDQNFLISPFEQISIDIGSSEQDVKTVFICYPRAAASVAGDNHRASKKPAVAVLDNLLPLYGFRVEQGDTFGMITTQEAAKVYAHIMLNRTNADTVSLKVPCTPNWTAWLNRPVLIGSRRMLATTKSVNQSIVWQSDASTEYNLWHAKFWDGRYVSDKGTGTSYTQEISTIERLGQGGPLRELFVPFGGVNARPFNYVYLLGIENRATAISASQTTPANKSTATTAENTKKGTR